jgi:2-dehydro-3-deoxygluconokinase
MDSTKKAVFFGELLMRLGTKRFERFTQAREFEIGYTGAEANAAVCLAHFGIETYVVSAVPDNEIGQACLNCLRQFGVNTDFVSRSGSRLGTFYLETGVSQRPSKVIYDRTGSSITELRPGQINWDAIFDGKHWFHWSGTAPALSDSMAEVIAQACQAARRHGITTSCDLNYRSKLWSHSKARPVMTELMRDVDVLIGNAHDIALVLGVESKKIQSQNETGVVAASREIVQALHQRFGFKYVAMTFRTSPSASEAGWSCLLSDGKVSEISRSYRIWIVDRVGGGDAFSGALIYGLLTGMSTHETVEFAAAAACLKHSIHGDLNLVSRNEVLALVAGDESGRIQR